MTDSKLPKMENPFARSSRSAVQQRIDLPHLLICMLITGLAVFLLSTGRLDRFENLVLDAFLKNRPPAAGESSVLLIEIDRESLQAIGPWPWPWRYYAEMIDILKKHQARAAIFDFPLKSPSFEEDKALLSKALADAENVYLPVSLESKTNKKFWIHSLPVDLEPAGERTVWAHPPLEIEARADGTGHTNLEPDSDGVTRRVKAVLSYGQESHPYLALAAAWQIKHNGARLPQNAELEMPLDEAGRLMVNWYGKWKESFQRISFSDVVRSSQASEKGLRPMTNLDSLKGKICLIGLTSSEFSNTYLTPLEPGVPSVAIQANVLSSVSQGRYLTPASFTLNAFYLCIVGFLASLAFTLLRNVSAFLLGLGLGVLWLALSYGVFWYQSIWVYSLQPVLLTLVLFIFSAIYTTFVGSRERSKLFDLATRDGLTGLFVIRHFREILNQAVKEVQEKKEPLCIALIDIDNFKKINDTYGHPAGDMVLKTTAEIVCRHCRSRRPLHKVDFAARYGGEELIIMFRGTKLADAAFKAAERVRKAVEEHVFDWEGQAIKVTISLGVGSLHSGENIPDLMVRRADEALYRAKRAGKNQVCVETFAAG